MASRADENPLRLTKVDGDFSVENSGNWRYVVVNSCATLLQQKSRFETEYLHSAEDLRN